MNVTILGAGAFGQALGKILTDNRHTVSFYDPFIYPEISLEQSLVNAAVAIICVPSSAIPQLLADYPTRYKTIPTILAAKGLLGDDLFAEFTQFSVLSGPGFAQDILDGKTVTFTVSSPIAKALFENERTIVELCDDNKGILYCGALKNVYAIGAGFRCANEFETEGYIMFAYKELGDYLANHGAKRETANYACGIGDLRLTCGGAKSRNRSCGEALRNGEQLEDIIARLHTIEGLETAKILGDTAGYPLLHFVQDLIAD